MKKLRVGFALLFVAVGGLVLKTFRDAGQFKTLVPHVAGQCVPVPGMVGAEDITFHPTLGYAYVSSDDRRATQAKHPVTGGIYRYDPAGNAPPVLLTGAFQKDFHPHGIGLFVAPDGAQTLYVVNHLEAGGNRIERFTVGEDGMLVAGQPIGGPELVSPNDVIPVDADRFYVTNDHGNPRGLAQKLEDYLQLSLGNVLYYDGKGFQEVVKGTAYANGINRSADGLTVYLAQSVGKRIDSYARDPQTGGLTPRDTVLLDSGPDNIEVDEAGNLWVATHPKMLTFVAYAEDTTGTKHAPAQVLRLTGTLKDTKVDEVFLDDEGKRTSGTATAAVFGKHMLLGPIFEKNLLNCDRP